MNNYFICTEDDHVYTMHDLEIIFNEEVKRGHVSIEDGETFEIWLDSALDYNGGLRELRPSSSDEDIPTLRMILSSIENISDVWCDSLNRFLSLDDIRDDNEDIYNFILDNYRVYSVEPYLFGDEIDYTVNVK